jgi:hypothetical protein
VPQLGDEISRAAVFDSQLHARRLLGDHLLQVTRPLTADATTTATAVIGKPSISVQQVSPTRASIEGEPKIEQPKNWKPQVRIAATSFARFLALRH